MRSEHVCYVRPGLLLKPSLRPNLKKSQGSLAPPRAEHAQEVCSCFTTAITASGILDECRCFPVFLTCFGMSLGSEISPEMTAITVLVLTGI